MRAVRVPSVLFLVSEVHSDVSFTGTMQAGTETKRVPAETDDIAGRGYRSGADYGMSECRRCANCCRVLVIPVKFCSKHHQHYLRTHGLKEDQGFFLIPHDCQHLQFQPENRFMPDIGGKYSCDIHDDATRPANCRVWIGQKTIKGERIYIPPECAFNNKS